MKAASVNKWPLMLLAIVMMTPSWAAAEVTFGRIVVFGTSLSDPGNAFALTGEVTKPPYDTLDQFLVPDAPYARGGHHFSNGATWIEQFARSLGLAQSVRPAFQKLDASATNYAVGSARARDDGVNFNLSAQVDTFLFDFGGVAPSDALYVVEIGATDVRDALIALSQGFDAAVIITAALIAIGDNIGRLYAAGARTFLVANLPNFGLLPATRILDNISPGAAQVAQLLSQTFNSGLDTLLGSLANLPSIEIAQLDVYQKVNELLMNPEAFDLSEVAAPCLTPNLPPFTCRKPDSFLFWDGIHPTKAVHGIFAQEAAHVLGQ
jgi:phospholipase/lecithinase/hemolysin